MSRVSLIQQLYTERKKDALEFDYDSLKAPPIGALFYPGDIEELKSIATSLKYSGNINKKYSMIDEVMKRRGFRRSHCGTNRVVYRFLEDNSFIAKVAVDRVGMADTPKEFINQLFLRPYCCKIFEVDPSGVIGFVERVNPISSIEEFMSVSDDIFNLMVIKVIGRYVVDDLGTKTYMNFGVRDLASLGTFGPVVIDYPYAYEVDGAKLSCAVQVINNITGQKEICGGEIDYRAGFNGLHCTKCGKEYTAMDLAKHNVDIKMLWDNDDDQFVKEIEHYFRARVVDNGKIILDSGHRSKLYLSKEVFEQMMSRQIPLGEIEVEKTEFKRRQHIKKIRDKYYSDLQEQYCLSQLNSEILENRVIKVDPVESEQEADSTSKKKSDSFNMSFTAPTSVKSKYAQEEIEVDTEGWEPERLIVNEFTHTPSSQVTQQVSLEEDNEPVSENGSVEVSDFNQNDYQEYSSEETQPEQVYSDDQVQEMVDAVVSMNQDIEDTGSSDENVVDPERDKNFPEESPMTRPYAGSVDNFNVTYRESEVDPMRGAPRAEVIIPKDDEPVHEALAINPDKQYGYMRRQQSHLKKARRNRYNNEES